MKIVLAVSINSAYLGSTITKNLGLNKEISKIISKAAMNFRLLQKQAWKNNRLSTKVKIHIYETCVLSLLLYCSETWTTYARNIKRLNSFHMWCLQKLLEIKWQDQIPHTEVLKRSGLTHLGKMIMQKWLRWLGHVKRMDVSRIPRTILFSEARNGSRKQGRPLLRYQDSCKNDMKSFDMNVDNWEVCAMQCSSWRENVTIRTRRYEQA